MRCARTFRWADMRRNHPVFKELGRPFRAVLVDCITHIFGFDLLQAHSRAERHSLLGTISIAL